jgi:hypothetical protein
VSFARVGLRRVMTSVWTPGGRWFLVAVVLTGTLLGLTASK